MYPVIQQLHPAFISTEMHTHVHQQTYTRFFTAVLLHNSLKLKKKFPSILNDMFTIGIPQSNENYNKAMPHFIALCFIVFHRDFVSYFANGRFVVTSRQTSQQMPFFFQQHLLAMCLCISFGNSHNISNLFIIIIFMKVIWDQRLWLTEAQMTESIFLAIKYF